MSTCKIKSIALFFSILIVISIFPNVALSQSNVRIDLSRETRKEVVIAISQFVAADPSSSSIAEALRGRDILEKMDNAQIEIVEYLSHL